MDDPYGDIGEKEETGDAISGNLRLVLGERSSRARLEAPERPQMVDRLPEEP